MNWPSVERLFAAALETPPGEREALLDSDPDDAVRAEVRRLLARHDALSSRRDSFLGALDLHRAGMLVDAVEAEDPPTVGRYEIVRRLGSGATGVVYLARDPSLARLVALKLLSPHLSHDATGIRRFTEEARAASRLDNPHIVAIHEIGRTPDDRLYIAMAYHEGETLRDRIARGSLPVAEAVRIAGDVADGLSAAHAQGIVHRDIKPENILLTARGACIVDFGIAKVVGETVTRTGAALGTAAYMSPEQTRGTRVDQRSDLWSLGVVLYEMLTGQRPFRAEAGEALIYSIRHDAAEPVTTWRPKVGPAAVRIVDRCLAKEPEERYQSAAELLSALRSPLQWTEGSWSVRQWRHVRLAIGGVAAVAATAAVVVMPKHPSPEEPLVQLSTVVPLPRQPGAIAIISPSDDRSFDPEPAGAFTAGCNTGDFYDRLMRGLSGTPGFHVASRPSVRIAVEAGADVPELGRRLGVTTVLNWNCRRSDGLVRVEARLIRVSDGRDLWSGAYERPIGERAEIPEEMRRSVAEALGFGRGDTADVPRAPTTDLVAYELYMRGQFARAKNTPAGSEEAVGLFREAIARDSSFALAYVRLAEASMETWSGAAADRYRRAKPLFAKALEVDSSLAYAHGMMGWIAMWQDRDWAAAERHLVLALAHDSSNVGNYYQYAAYLAATGRMEEGLAVVRRATALDPLSSITATEVGLHLYWNRRYPEAIAVLERALVVDTIWWQKMPVVLGRAYLAVGRYDDAIREFRRAGVQSSEGFEAPALLGYALGIAGRTHEARAYVNQYERRGYASSARPIELVALQLGVGDTAKALDWLERIPGDLGSRLYLVNEPIFDPLRGSPRFQRVLDRLGLAEAAKRADSIRAARAGRGDRS